MIVYPALDLLGNKVVRLKRGDYQQSTVYHASPLAQAKEFEDDGAKWIHIVDLDAARSQESDLEACIKSIVQETNLKVQLGGGIRSLEAIKKWHDLGVARTVIGTKALVEPDFLASASAKFPNFIALGLDVLKGEIRINGWQESHPLSLSDALLRAKDAGVAALIRTDIERDGVLGGLSETAIKQELAEQESLDLPFIVSGGVAEIADLKRLMKLRAALEQKDALSGVIIGRALYEKRFTLAQALAATKA